ncbi:hypothetical protein Moror_10265 [Moniliophthora roreri MCA 2997]|uniref:Uncharacterized protein n=2 Tax=Moniliophthora roreri TaxID=221103 RepID=V2WYY5_MONRO|nr:hypothetical protein Moror_10265 [Moniliophthora roreri MCA 2997]KAI3604513.1 hypothetical protein WG66_008739 [Moniliophthora roreri]
MTEPGAHLPHGDELPPPYHDIDTNDDLVTSPMSSSLQNIGITLRDPPTSPGLPQIGDTLAEYVLPVSQAAEP